MLDVKKRAVKFHSDLTIKELSKTTKQLFALPDATLSIAKYSSTTLNRNDLVKYHFGIYLGWWRLMFFWAFRNAYLLGFAIPNVMFIPYDLSWLAIPDDMILLELIWMGCWCSTGILWCGFRCIV